MTAAVVGSHLDKIEQSSVFRGSPRLCRLLRFAVSRAEAGRESELKESIIGVEVFGREPGYDAQASSIVRVEFARLRKKLEEFYESDGRREPVRICFPKGTYVPQVTQTSQAPGIAIPAVRAHLAVLPFAHLGSNADDEYFAAGLTDELITALGHIRQLRIVARTSAFAVRRQSDDVREIGRALKVNAVLEGSVRRQESRVRIHAQLIDTADGAQLWAEKYERELTGVFEIQDEITTAIVAALAIEMPRVARRLSAGTRNPRAHELYLKGRYWWHRANPAMYPRAIELFTEAIECDPTYAAPYSGLADTYFNRTAYGEVEPAIGAPQAERAVRKALELDETSAEAYCSLGLIESGLNWSTVRAGAAFQQSMDLNPSYALGTSKYGTMYLSPLERWDEAADYIQRALRLDPLSPNLNADLAANLAHRGRLDEFDVAARNVLEMDPGILRVYFVQIAVSAYLGKWNSAVDAADRACSVSTNPLVLGYASWAYAGAGQKGQAIKIRERLLAQSRSRYIPSIALAATYFHDDVEATFHHLELSLQARDPLIRHFLWQPHQFVSIRSDPRFHELKRRTGLQPGKVAQSPPVHLAG